MPPSRRAVHMPAAAVVVSVLLAAGCTPGATSTDEDGEAATGEPPSVTVTIPATRLTPFCRAMIDLNERLENDPPDDVEAEIVETYEDIADEVPEEIRADFDAVLADLRGGPPAATSDSPTTTTTTVTTITVTTITGAAPTSDPLADEGRSPGETPTERLSAYVDFACRSVENNPGPPPTQPLGPPATTEP